MSDEAILAALTRIEAAIAALREEVALGKHPPRRPAVTGLLAAIYEAVGVRKFTCYELADYVEVAEADELGAAIVAAAGSLNPRKLGKLLAAVEGEQVGGYTVRRTGDSREGLRWKITRSQE